jgi:pSer/pThr/pTyr-binding forkhead associated (FHA) protein
MSAICVLELATSTQQRDTGARPTAAALAHGGACADDGAVSFRLRFGLEEMDLAQPETTIGRDESCAVTIDDDLVSRRHAVFRRRGSHVEVEDLASRNGTRVNGVAIKEPTRLAHGDRVRIGPRELVFYDTDHQRAAGRRQNATGKLVACDRCGEVRPAETPSCPHCGAPQDPSRD